VPPLLEPLLALLLVPMPLLPPLDGPPLLPVLLVLLVLLVLPVLLPDAPLLPVPPKLPPLVLPLEPVLAAPPPPSGDSVPATLPPQSRTASDALAAKTRRRNARPARVMLMRGSIALLSPVIEPRWCPGAASCRSRS
jgi:hypothetical protein